MATIDKSKGEEKTAKKPKASDAPASPTTSMKEYIKGVRSEWNKISWPTWPQIWGQTIVVLVVTAIMTLGLWLMDNTFCTAVQLLTQDARKQCWRVDNN